MDPALRKELSELFDEKLKPLENAVASLKGDVDSLKGDVASLKGDVASLKGDVDSLKGDVDSLKKDVERNTTALTNLDERSKTDQKELQRRLGHIYELSLRQVLRQQHGEDFARSFTTEDLDGVASGFEYDLKMRLLEIDKHFKKPNVKEEPPHWLPTAHEQLAKYLSIPTGDANKRQQYILETRRFAILLITAHCIKQTQPWFAADDVPLRSQLEIDVRGECTVDFRQVTVDVGEIKSSASILSMDKACRQLSLTMAVLCYGYFNCQIGEVSFLLLKGHIFGPRQLKDCKAWWPNSVQADFPSRSSGKCLLDVRPLVV
ncbi:hypothetical protein HK097_004217 [Rhizophlyctis rosea]|uniref:Uncharacterized protein n=1 Tax=Rhizophlyctis rosea TaxID=64517 RepID=A0AAD5S3I1_9FUNG|nr:hypothetical protein HK097_004217 [Rhizophlyctis rosea]